MEPIKIRGMWRWVDAAGQYHRGTDAEYQAFLGVVPAPVVETAPEPAGEPLA